MRVPLFVVGSLCIGALVAASCVLSFQVTRANAEASIDTVSRQLSTNNIKSARDAIARDLLEEPERYLTTLTDGYNKQMYGPFHPGMFGFSSETARRVYHEGNAYLSRSSSSATFLALMQSDDGGFLVRLGRTYAELSSEGMHVARGDETTSSFTLRDINRTITLLLRTRPYYTVVSGSDELRNGGKVWTEITHTMDNEYAGLIVSLSTAVRHPVSGNFFGVATVTVGFQWIDLSPYVSHSSINMLVIDDKYQLVASTSTAAYDPGAADYRVPLNSSLNTTSLYRAVYGVLPMLHTIDENGQHFKKFDFEGATWWLEVYPLSSYNLHLYLVSLTPEAIYFDEIYASNARTTYIVVGLVVGSALLAMGFILLATLPLYRLAKAFDCLAAMQLDADAVLRIPKQSAVWELNGLQRGFRHALQTVKQVQAFIPVMGPPEQEDGNMIFTQTGTAADEGITDHLAIGLKHTSKATILCFIASGFDTLCTQADLTEAVEHHGKMFGKLCDLVRRRYGSLLGVRGDKVLVGWGLSKVQGSAVQMNALQLAMQLSTIEEPSQLLPVGMGLHTSSSVHGILGSTSQRFQVFGSSLDDVSYSLAMQGVDYGLAIVGSGAFVKAQGLVVHHQIDVVMVPGQVAPIIAYWVTAIASVSEVEWMYQLEEAAREAQDFLDPFFAAFSEGEYDLAGVELRSFQTKHPEHRKLAQKHSASLAAARGVVVP